MAQREDIAQQNIALRKDLAAAGLLFNDVDPKPFRDKLSEVRLLQGVEGKFGEDAWSLLEETGGKLA